MVSSTTELILNPVTKRTPITLATLAFVLVTTLLAHPVSALAADTTHVYRLLNSYDGQHLITTDENEYRELQRVGWKGEGNVFDVPNKSTVSVYRLFNKYNGDHLYTTDENEYATLQHSGWEGEGAKFFAAPEGEGVAIYRLWNSAQTNGAGAHLWTADHNEYNTLPNIDSAWRQENIAWRGYEVPALSNPSYVDGSYNKKETHTLRGTVVREELTTDDTGMGFSGAYYFLKLDTPLTLTFNDAYSTDMHTEQRSKILLGSVEKYAASGSVGWENVNKDLYKLIDEELQPYAGFRVSVTGSFGLMTSHTPDGPCLIRTSISRIS